MSYDRQVLTRPPKRVKVTRKFAEEWTSRFFGASVGDFDREASS